jgi:hypothetical protein
MLVEVDSTTPLIDALHCEPGVHTFCWLSGLCYSDRFHPHLLPSDRGPLFPLKPTFQSQLPRPWS